MKEKGDWFDRKVASVSSAVKDEVQMSAEIIARIDYLLKKKGMTQRDLAKKMGKPESAVSRWISGFPNLTLRSISELSAALNEQLIVIPGSPDKDIIAE